MDVVVESIADDAQQPTPQSAMPSDSKSYFILARHFDVDTPTKEEEKMLREVYNYGLGSSITGEPSDVLWQVMELGRSLGAHRLGADRLGRVYRYAKLKRQEQSIQEELRRV